MLHLELEDRVPSWKNVESVKVSNIGPPCESVVVVVVIDTSPGVDKSEVKSGSKENANPIVFEV